MKIVHVNGKYFPDLDGGSVIYSHDLVNNISRLGHEVKIFCASRDPSAGKYKVKKSIVEGIEIARVNIKDEDTLHRILPYFRFYKPCIAAIFKDYLLGEKPDLVHFHTPVELGASLVSVPGELGIPTVATLHEGWWVCRQNAFNNKIYSLPCKTKNIPDCVICVADPGKKERLHAFKFIFRLMVSVLNTVLINSYILKKLKDIDLLIAPSLFLADRYISAGVRKGKIILIPSGIDTGIFKEIRRPKSSKVRFGFIGGRDITAKGFTVLMGAAEKLKDKNKFSLRIWGQIDRNSATGIIARNPELDIQFCNKFQRDELSTVFSSLDVLIIPSLVSENCPLIILEAFAAGVPVIASNVGGIKELVREGENGLLFDFADSGGLAGKMREVISRPRLIAEMASKIKVVKNIEGHAKEIMGVYSGLIQRKYSITKGAPGVVLENITRCRQYEYDQSLF